MSRNYCNLSELAAAAARAGCTAHTHQNDQGQTVYSIGSEDIGGAEFNSYAEALAWASNRSKHTEGELYANTDGQSIAWNEETGELSIYSPSTAPVHIEIGSVGLRYLAESMIDALDDDSYWCYLEGLENREVASAPSRAEQNRRTDEKRIIAGDAAEIEGSDIARVLLDNLLQSENQAQKSILIHAALIDLQHLPHAKRAAGGFAVMLVNVLEVGLQHLPKGGEQ